MDISSLVDGGMSFFREHTFWGVLAVAAIGTFIYWKRKSMLKVALAGLAVGAIIYVLSFLLDLTSRGIDETDKFKSAPNVKVK